MDLHWLKTILDLSAANKPQFCGKRDFLHETETPLSIGKRFDEIDKLTSPNSKRAEHIHIRLWITGLSRYLMLTSLLSGRHCCWRIAKCSEGALRLSQTRSTQGRPYEHTHAQDCSSSRLSGQLLASTCLTREIRNCITVALFRMFDESTNELRSHWTREAEQSGSKYRPLSLWISPTVNDPVDNERKSCYGVGPPHQARLL
jgi:hypothetical protein